MKQGYNTTPYSKKNTTTGWIWITTAPWWRYYTKINSPWQERGYMYLLCRRSYKPKKLSQMLQTKEFHARKKICDPPLTRNEMSINLSTPRTRNTRPSTINCMFYLHQPSVTIIMLVVVNTKCKMSRVAVNVVPPYDKKNHEWLYWMRLTVVFGRSDLWL
jgi:hypothetical protein